MSFVATGKHAMAGENIISSEHPVGDDVLRAMFASSRTQQSQSSRYEASGDYAVTGINIYQQSKAPTAATAGSEKPVVEDAGCSAVTSTANASSSRAKSLQPAVTVALLGPNIGRTSAQGPPALPPRKDSASGAGQGGDTSEIYVDLTNHVEDMSTSDTIYEELDTP
eukprot:Opistho-2@78482